MGETGETRSWGGEGALGGLPGTGEATQGVTKRLPARWPARAGHPEGDHVKAYLPRSGRVDNGAAIKNQRANEGIPGKGACGEACSTRGTQ